MGDERHSYWLALGVGVMSQLLDKAWPEAPIQLYWFLVAVAGLAALYGLWGTATNFWFKNSTKSASRPEDKLCPDFTISELFHTLDPRVLEEPRWLAVGQVVRDKLAIEGQLACWGRPVIKDWIQELVEPYTKPALTLIPHTYWQKAHFSYMHFTDEFKYAPHTSPDWGSDLPEYADLQFNKAQVLGLDWSAIERFRTEIGEKISERHIRK